MSIEIDVLNGDASWALVEPLYEAVWPPHVLKTLPWADVVFAHADLRVLVRGAADDIVYHVGIYRRVVIWNGRKLHAGGIGGVLTREDARQRGHASIALDAAIQILKDERSIDFALLFCEPYRAPFYIARGWKPFEGEIYAEQPDKGRIRFDILVPLVFDVRRALRQGVLDLCGLPW
jgi:aminoglycoside 2'-N-acetyltransferase I